MTYETQRGTVTLSILLIGSGSEVMAVSGKGSEVQGFSSPTRKQVRGKGLKVPRVVGCQPRAARGQLCSRELRRHHKYECHLACLAVPAACVPGDMCLQTLQSLELLQLSWPQPIPTPVASQTHGTSRTNPGRCEPGAASRGCGRGQVDVTFPAARPDRPPDAARRPVR